MRRFNLPRLIGIAGRAGSGKDTLAAYLQNQHAYSRYAFADPIKRLLNERFGWTEENWSNRRFKEIPSAQCGHNAVEDYASQLFSPRSWVRWLGTDVGRRVFGENVWVDMMEREWNKLAGYSYICGDGETPNKNAYMVVSDVRFDNEAQRILMLGGVIIRIVRPNAPPSEEHASERGITDELVNVQVTNDTDVITFLRNCVYALETCPRGA